MSDSTATLVDPPAGLAVTDATAQAVQASGQKPTANPVLETDLPPQALKDRLEQARARGQADLLAKFGGAKPEDIAAKLKRLQELEDASLSERERAEKQIAELRVQAAEADRYRALFGEQTAAELAALSEEQRAAVVMYAGDNPVEQHKMVQAFRMAGAVKNAAGVAPPSPAPPAPATTVPAGTPPAPASGVKTRAQEWQELRELDPISGQLFYQQNAREIVA